MSEKTKNIPKLRFPEFVDDGEWEEKNISDVCEKPYSGGTPSSRVKEYYGGSIPFIRSAEINKAQTELFLTNKGLKNSSAKFVKKGDVLIALYGANSGDVAISKIEGAINQAILCLNSKDSNSFLYQYLVLKKDWIVAKYIQGGQGNLSGEIIKSIELKFPKPNEQQKIADFLSSIDEQITQNIKKVELLKKHKKGLLQNLFPSEGENVPRLRFPEFVNDGEWEEKKLGNIGIFLRGLTYSSSDVEESGLLVLRSSNIQDDNLVLNKDLVFVNKSCSNELLLKNGDICICMSNGSKELVGKSATYLGNYDAQITIGAFCSLFRPKISLAKYVFQTNSYQRFVALSIGGGNINNLKNSDLEIFSIHIPKTTEEQQKIADCLSSLDELITSSTKKVELLKEHKKGLMQQLFPSKEVD
jgi:type I restriction enzyme S subunit